jgi:hypothetical protein
MRRRKRSAPRTSPPSDASSHGTWASTQLRGRYGAYQRRVRLALSSAGRRAESCSARAASVACGRPCSDPVVAWGRQSLAPSSARRAEATRIAHLSAQNRESSTWSFLALRERRAADDAREAAATCARAGSARCSSCRGPVGGLPKGYHLVRHEDHRTESIGGEVP